MAKRPDDVCPGCSRHCSLNNVRCKYGQKYAEKIQKKQKEQKEQKEYPVRDAGHKAHHRKWEKHVTPGDLVWNLLSSGSRIKRALRHREITEQQLLRTLDEAEQAQLSALLDKLTGALA